MLEAANDLQVVEFLPRGKPFRPRDAGRGYLLTTTGTLNGQPYTSWDYAFDTNDGKIDVYNGDSELWTQWVWDRDHYDKVGGTTNQRSYYPGQPSVLVAHLGQRAQGFRLAFREVGAVLASVHPRMA